MEETNYCTQAIESIDRYMSSSDAPLTKDDLYIKMLRSLLLNGQKFRVPDYGKIIDLPDSRSESIARDYLQAFRLPYPITILEYQHPVCKGGHGTMEFDACVVIAVENPLENCIMVVGMYRTRVSGRKHWLPINFGARLQPDGKAQPFPATSDADAWLARTDLPDRDRWGMTDIENEASAVLLLMAALSCSNIQTKEMPAPDKLNIKRSKSGKQPFFSYRVLMLDEMAEPKGHALGGSHASPRVHLRRGHIRRLPGKQVWVNSSVVGCKELGSVGKSYAMKNARPT